MIDPSRACVCGWPRALIALVNEDGSEVPKTVVPIIVCPVCGAMHTPKKIPMSVAASLVRELDEQLIVASLDRDPSEPTS